MEASDDEDDYDDKAAELKSELEEVRAELEAVKTDAAGSAGPKGGIQTTEKDADPAETDEQDETKETRAASVTAEAAKF